MKVLFRVATILLIAVPQVAWAQEKSPHPPTALDILAQALQVSDSLPAIERDRVLAKIATAQARAGDLKAALTSVNEIEFVPYRQGAIVDIASVLVQRGEQAAASSVLDQFVDELVHGDSEHIVTSLRDIATAQVRFDDVLAARETCRKALRIIDGIKITQQHDVALRDIAVVQVKARDADAARQTAQRIQERGRKDEAFALIAMRQAELGDWREALQTIQALDDDSVIFPLIEIVSAQAKSGEMQEADDTIEMIKTRIEKPQYASIIVDLASSMVARAMFERGNIEAAMERLKSVSDPLIKSKALARIAEVQEENGDLKGALKTLGSVDLKGALKTLGSVVQNSWTSSTIARLQAKTGDTRGALQTAETIEDSFRRACAYIDIAKSQTTTGDDVFAVASLEKASNAARSVNRQNRDTVMSNIAAAYGEAGNYIAAAKMSQAIQSESGKSSALFEIAKDRSKAGDLVGALDTANKMSSAVEKSFALIGAAEGLLE